MELTIQELADILCSKRDVAQGVAPQRLTVKQRNVIIRTVTHYYVGTLVDQDDRWLYLNECSWIADTGRWSTALEKGTLTEVEPYPSDVIVQVAIGAVVDMADWQHNLPRSVK